MYKYKKRYINSTKSSTIFDSKGKKVGVVQKYYNNIFKKIIGNITFGYFFERYLFKDDEDKIIVKSRKLVLSQKRKYILSYFDANSKEYNEIYLNKKEKFNREKIGLFEYENHLFTVSVDKKEHCKMIDTKDNNEVASWNQRGDYIYLKFKGSFVEKHKLFTIAILHTFSNNNIYYNHTDITRPPMGPPSM